MFIATIQNSPKLETTQMTFDQKIDNVIYSYTGILFTNKKNELPSHIKIWMNLKNTVVWKKQVTKEYKPHDFIYMKFQSR